MRKLFLTLALSCALIFPSSLIADEGMWMVNLLENGLMSKMKKAGIKLPANVIYDENAVSISDAIVSLDFGCTGSMISNNGLLITNHHCAYGDVHSISTDENNYLEDGFWAMSPKEEVHIKDKGAYFLRKVIDITNEVIELRESAAKKGQKIGGRKLCFMLEKKYKKEYSLEASLHSMWSGEKYYIFLYEVYKDVRLVAAPPVSIAAYGGETDNWEWPQHKGDFAMYRIYGDKDGKPAEFSENNVPIQPKRILSISTKGVKKGDFTMVMGYPGHTDRYNSSFGVNYKEKIKDPITSSLTRARLDIMNKWMNSDPAIRLKYADTYFSYSNVQEYQSGEMLTLRRYGVIDIKKQQEKELQQWIEADPQRMEKWGTLLADLTKVYANTEDLEKQIIYYRESLVRSGLMYLLSTRVSKIIRESVGKRKDLDTTLIKMADHKRCIKEMEGINEEYDLRVEKDIYKFALKTYIENVNHKYWSENMKNLFERFDEDIDKLFDYSWSNSFLSDSDRFYKYINEEHSIAEIKLDPIYTVFEGISIIVFNQYVSKEEKKCGKTVRAFEKEYTNAMYEMNQDKGRVQYPDANSTMRLTYGTVGSINPSDGIYYSEYTTAEGILQKWNPDDYEFKLKDQSIQLLKNKDWGQWADKKTKTLHINFLSNNDITGGNSGSPVMNAKGEIIGLAFDGNKESLCGDAYFHPEYNKCVNVDIRYVLWILDKYAGMNYIFNELDLK